VQCLSRLYFIDSSQWHSEGTLRTGARNILAPPLTKTTEFEEEIGAKVRKKQSRVSIVVPLFFFRVIKLIYLFKTKLN